MSNKQIFLKGQEALKEAQKKKRSNLPPNQPRTPTKPPLNQINKFLTKTVPPLELLTEGQDFKKWLEEILNNKIENLGQKIDKALVEFSAKVATLERANNKLETELKIVKESYAKLEKDNQNALSERRKMDKAQELLQSRVVLLEEKLEQEESQKRRRNLVFYGIQQRRDENKDEIKETLQKFLKNKMDVDVEIAELRRIGRPNNNTPAPLITTIPNETTRSSILKNGRKLKGTDIFVSPDLSIKTRQNRKILNSLRLEAIKERKRAFFRGDFLQIEDKTFGVVDNNITEINQTTE